MALSWTPTEIKLANGVYKKKGDNMRYKQRYPTDEQKQAAYENACDCLYYGYGRNYWNSCGLDEPTSQEVWKQAHEDMINDF